MSNQEDNYENYEGDDVSYEESQVEDEVESDIEEQPKKAANPQKANIIMYGAIVLLVGFVGYQTVGKKLLNSSDAPKSQPPVAQQQVPQTPPSQPQVTQQPSAEATSAAIPVAPTPSANEQVAMPAVDTSAVQAVVVPGSTTVTESVLSTDVAVPQTSAVIVQPEPVIPTEKVAPAPIVAVPEVSQNKPVADGASAILKEVANMISDHANRIGELEHRMTMVEDTIKNKVLIDIERIQDKVSKIKSGAVSSGVKIPYGTKTTKSVKSKNVLGSDMAFKIEYGDDAVGASKNESMIVDNKSSNINTVPSVNKTLTGADNLFAEPVPAMGKIQAIIAGRVWLKDEEGNSHTYVEGDTLPDGRQVKRIDADKLEIVTNGGVIK